MTAATPPPESPPPAPPSDWTAPPPAQAGPAPGLRYGGFWVRFIAIFLDGIVIGVITSALAVFALGGEMMVTTTEAGVLTFNTTTNAFGALVGLLYFVGFWGWRGQTPGMIPFNMRVVMADDGSKPDWVRMLLRYVGLLISIAVFFLGVIWAGFDRRKQGWHDKIAGTVVVRPA
ncbi:MAG TPA: RDD family protein [Candidatus Limnocylindria bacterium]|nr:RDD family protein [Candidatus Limnocylindria bacterium]